MDGQRFDRLTLHIVRSLNRRRLAHTLAAFGLTAGSGLGAPAVAKRKKKKKCKGGTTKCGNACVNLQTNPAHCGGCNQPCGGTSCVNGSCQNGGTCQSPNTLCNGACVDPRSDRNNCGTCGAVCGSGQNCVNSSCVSTCNPACASDRDCYQGKCTCTGGQCLRDRDPDGDACVVNPPGRPDLGWCGCITNFTVCAVGEACSFCCTDQFCRDLLTGVAGAVCALPPAGVYRSRGCCIDVGSPCDSNDDCCSRRCNINQQICECAPPGTNCSYGRGCCSGTCSAITGQCA